MFHIFAQEKWITVFMAGFFLLSIVGRIFLGRMYQKMIKETDSMAVTDNRALKQCKTKFTGCYQMNKGVSNVPVFVDKFLSRMTLGAFSFEFLYHLSGQMMLLSVLMAGIGVCKSLLAGRTLGEILPFYIFSFGGLYLYFSISDLVDIRGKKKILKVHLVDYLENHLVPRMELAGQEREELSKKMADKPVNLGRKIREISEKEQEKATVEVLPLWEKKSGKEDSGEELEKLLREFLTV